MDPRDNRDRNSSFWLPRTRGDGPLLGASSLRPSTAPPHPRGWTPILSCVSYRYRGSPAPAGMDLDDRCAACVAEWLPRTRGDGPDQQGASRHQDGAPPHPRGWTPGACGGSTRGAGSPAPAGMDPRSRRQSGIWTGLPRTRGDGPDAGVPRHHPGQAPPHPRGWTLRPQRDRRDHGGAPPHPRGWTPRGRHAAGSARGSPAPAGMDPPGDLLMSPLLRLPRTRGDGPYAASSGKKFRMAPPHPRGWTPCLLLRGRGRKGSPAPAGMDPNPSTPPPSRPRLPRTRGDGPAPNRSRLLRCLAPPHPRGWTRRSRDRRAVRPGSPAPAGMDPTMPPRRGRPARLPRTRGDGPSSSFCPSARTRAPPHPRGWTPWSAAGGDVWEGSPAPAGMDLIASVQWTPRLRLPRTRGDGPPGVCGCCGGARAPPHPRGWTRPADPGARPAAGSPAPAGMDPTPPPIPHHQLRLPRTRGDGPNNNNIGTFVGSAPPHPRGWTHKDSGREEQQDGSPAPAGMDPARWCSRPATARLPRTRGDGPL